VLSRARHRRRWPARIAGLLGTAALLGAGAAIAMMVIPSPEDDAGVPAAPAATPEGGREPSLTRAERRARRAAAALLAEQGLRPARLGDYDPRSRLRILLARPADDESGDRRAFFFAGRRFAGNDADTPSAQLRVVRAGDRSVTLQYGLYEAGDRRCCPQGGTARVRFRLEGGAVEPRGEVPPAAARTP
jgi:LppP/LprE lipoprotein